MPSPSSGVRPQDYATVFGYRGLNLDAFPVGCLVDSGPDTGVHALEVNAVGKFPYLPVEPFPPRVVGHASNVSGECFKYFSHLRKAFL